MTSSWVLGEGAPLICENTTAAEPTRRTSSNSIDFTASLGLKSIRFSNAFERTSKKRAENP